MSVVRLVLREMRFRPLGFALGVVSVVVAVACVVGATTLLRSYDQKTDQLAAQKEKATEAEMRQLQEDFRKLTLKMGFTTVIVHKDQDLKDMFARGHATVDMPEEYGDRLAARKVATINHILPTLQQRMPWPEMNDAPIQLIGVKGEVYIQSRFQKPLLEAVPEGAMVIGQQVGRRLNLKVGDDVKLKGRPYRITGIRAGSGGVQDLGVWVKLADVQRMLGKPGQINEILAVDCMCPGDRVSVIQAEIGRILDHKVQVFENVDVATARSESRRRVDEAAKAAAANERQGRAALRADRQSFARFLIPTVVIGCMVWIGLLIHGNVRERRAEIGILRAIGMRGRQILLVFLSKAMLMGLLGAGVGYVAGLIVGQSWETGAVQWSGALFDPKLLGSVLVAAPVLACAASWLPAVLAARQDPAVVLQRE
jgi:ABC-type lipoprotein release transport system permease subunit